MNYSRQRELIIELLRSTTEHPTAETVYRALKSEYSRLSLATVYRNLNQLCEMGIIKKLHIADSPDRFDGNTATHYHLCCKVCKSVIDIEVSIDDFRILQSITTQHHISGCDIVFYGTCAQCIEKEQEQLK